jgi:kynurenine formamidase
VLLDVTQPIAAGMPRIHVLPEVRIEPVTRIADARPLNIAQLHLATHAGTHIDAPVHALPDGRSIDQLPLDQFIGPGAVVSVWRDGGEEISLQDVLNAPVDVRARDILLLDTGWGARFYEESYNHHPYPSLELAQWCVDQRIKMLGVDCITVDAPVASRPQDFAYPIHRTLLGAEVLIIENLAALSAAANKRVQVYAFPLKIADGDAGHARVVLEVTGSESDAKEHV